VIVSIGMLARNEAPRIAHTLRSLLQQSVFAADGRTLPQTQWELVIVPNGCADATAEVARATLAQLAPASISASVIEVPAAGKSSAWNRYIHEFSRKDADFIIMLDADIEFGHRDTIRNSLDELAANRCADVVVDRPVNSIVRKQTKTFLEKIRVKLAGSRFDGPPGIAGSFYCARAHLLRAIWMPSGLAAEDGFLRDMVITNLFRSEVDFSRVVRAKDASHFYEATAGFAQTFKHELRIAIGTTLNCYLAWDFLRFATDPQGPGAGVLIKSRIEHDPDWYRKYIDNEIRQRGWWVLPRGMVFRSFDRLRNLTLRNRLQRIPVVVALFLFDLAVCVAANNLLKKRAAVGFW
jgi:glycosyltransferase involved in cell wall biosynthesis